MWLTWATGCGFPRPADVADDTPSPSCVANRPQRCNGSGLVRCNSDGTAEVTETCALGCSTGELRCKDVDPSNGLAALLDMTAGEPHLDLGMTATINTDDGSVVADGRPVAVRSATMAQASAPTIRVLIVQSLTAVDVTVTGRNALAVICNGDLEIGGVFAASASRNIPGPGAFNDGACKGGDAIIQEGGGGFSGCGGGGFGLSGAHGGLLTTDIGTTDGGAGGTATGNASLVPLHGGCDSGNYGNATSFGAGGGALQLVSRTRIAIGGVLAANGAAFIGGGSGGGILLEAPIVEVSGGVVANGGAGAGGCLFPTPGESGRLDSRPAVGTAGCSNGGKGGNGGAGTISAEIGSGITLSGNVGYGGHGGGSVGRIRVNTISGGLHVTGLVSPNPSTGSIAIR